VNVKRWYGFIESQEAVQAFLKALPDELKKGPSPTPAPSDKSTGRKEEGKFEELPGAEMGKVVVRFPPEASG